MLEVIFSNPQLFEEHVKVITMWENHPSSTNFLSDDESILVQKAIEQSNFKGQKNDSLVVYGGNQKIILIGLGKDNNSTTAKQVGQTVFNLLKNDEKAYISCDDNFATNLAYGILLGSYSFDKYKTEKKLEEYTKLEQLIFCTTKPESLNLAFKPLLALANGIRYCKDLCNEPSNYLTPEVFAQDIKRLSYLGLDITILDSEQIKQSGFGLIDAIGKSSTNQAQIAIIQWLGNKDQSSFDIGFVGKGVCFDSGGLNLKNATNLFEMKMDMAGAAAIVATMKVAALRRTRKNLIAIVGLAENIPSGNSAKIGDIYTSYNGKTVEILNTDAEGRLIIADCLAYLQSNHQIKQIIDLATLGSLKSVLGSVYAAIFSNNTSLSNSLLSAGEKTGELLWPMPLNNKYLQMLTSDIADIKNIAPSGKASIVSAAFLSSFIEKDQPWAHIDMSTVKTDTHGLASGFGVELLSQIIEDLP